MSSLLADTWARTEAGVQGNGTLPPTAWHILDKFPSLRFSSHQCLHTGLLGFSRKRPVWRTSWRRAATIGQGSATVGVVSKACWGAPEWVSACEQTFHKTWRRWQNSSLHWWDTFLLAQLWLCSNSDNNKSLCLGFQTKHRWDLCDQLETLLMSLKHVHGRTKKH